MSGFNLKKWIKRHILKRKVTSRDVLEDLRKGGAQIGEDVFVYSTGKTLIDAQAPYLLTIGSHVRIAEGVKILTHDYAWSVLKSYACDGDVPGAVLGAQGPVQIGSHVFIGMNAIITRGVTIGNHVIIGAGSVVTRDCPSGGVYAGNPAKRIMDIREYYRKRQALQFREARVLARCYKNRFQKDPPQEIFSEYFQLFATAEEAQKVPAFREQMARVGNFEETLLYMQHHAPQFDGYGAFLQACYQDEEDDR